VEALGFILRERVTAAHGEPQAVSSADELFKRAAVWG
jgi:hypothetical protein